MSSVQKEFADERKNLTDYLRKDMLLKDFFEPVLFEEIPANTHSPESVYLKEVESSDIYLGLLGSEYGYEDEDGISPTEREYDHAKSEGIQRWILIKGDHKIKRHPKENRFIKKIGNDVSRKRFSNLTELNNEFYQASILYLKQLGRIESSDFDESLHRDATLADISDKHIRDFVLLARKKRGFPLRETADAKNVLKHLNMYRNNQLTNSALLVFGLNPQRFFPAATVKCAHFHGLSVGKPIPDYKEFSGRISDLTQSATDFVLSKLSLSTGTREKSNIADTVYEIPRRMVAEAIINAVAHRDYRSKGSVQVSVFRDRVEILNPGALPPELDLSELSKPHGSYPHNPLLAGCMFLTGEIERFGTGTLEIFNLSEQNELDRPLFSLDQGFKVVLWRPSARTAHDTAQVTAHDTAHDENFPSLVVLAQRVVWVIDTPMSRAQIMERLELKHRQSFVEKYLNPALQNKWIELTIPDKPKSKNQQYRLTRKGKQLKKTWKKN